MVHENVSIFGLKFDLDPVAFTIPGLNWDIYWYGVIIATGFLLALVYAFVNAKRFNIDVDRMIDVILVAAPVAIVCARLYYVAFDGVPVTSISDIFDFSSGGMRGLAIYGGIIGALLSGVVMCKIRKVKILDMFDLAGIGFLIGQGIGRWGNFFNQEAFGSNTTLPWGMTSDTVVSYLTTYQDSLAEIGVTVDPALPVHPCFLYEFIWCAIGFVLLHILSKRRAFSGQVFLGYCAWYGLGRFFIEGLRVDSLMVGGSDIRVSMWLSLVLAVAGVAVMATVLRSIKKKKAVPEYTSVFGAEELDNFLEENADPADETADEEPQDITEQAKEETEK